MKTQIITNNDGDAVVIKCIKDNVICGEIHAEKRHWETEYYVSYFYVAKDKRRKGYCNFLLKSLVSFMDSIFCDVSLDVIPYDSGMELEDLIKLYKTHGFSEVVNTRYVYYNNFLPVKNMAEGVIKALRNKCGDSLHITESINPYAVFRKIQVDISYTGSKCSEPIHRGSFIVSDTPYVDDFTFPVVVADYDEYLENTKYFPANAVIINGGMPLSAARLLMTLFWKG